MSKSSNDIKKSESPRSASGSTSGNTRTTKSKNKNMEQSELGSEVNERAKWASTHHNKTHLKADYMKIAENMIQTDIAGTSAKELLRTESTASEQTEYSLDTTIDLDNDDIVAAEINEYTTLDEHHKTDKKIELTSVGKDENDNILHDFHRVNITGEESISVPQRDYITASGLIYDALSFREKWMMLAGQSFNPTCARYLRQVDGEEVESIGKVAPERPFDLVGKNMPYDGNWKTTLKKNLGWNFKMQDGCLAIYATEDDMKQNNRLEDYAYPNLTDFIEDHSVLMAMMANGPCKSYCYQRLQFLDSKYTLHDLLNGPAEKKAQKECPHRDFYNCRKVDTHIHASGCPNQKHLLKFIKRTLEEDGEKKVCVRDGKELTLKQVFESLNVNAYDLTVDSLDCHADRNVYHRFDNFNAKYNPMGVGLLREIYIKTNNYIDGLYFAQIIKEVMKELEDQRYTYAELRLSVYGNRYSEFDSLAKWAVNHKVYSDQVRWLIQVPRIYDIFRKNNSIKNFGEFLNNIFTPVLEASINPRAHPELAKFLEHVTGFDSVDDESKPESHFFSTKTPLPDQWVKSKNPSYSYYLWYMYCNIAVINQVRQERGMNTFVLRPHCGEAGALHHLCSAFLLSENIAHGLQLKKVPVLEYVYYLAQVGICMSPLSNNHLFCEYRRSPFETYLKRGLNVSLSTDDPLQFHFTKEPLMEEYSIASQVWKLTSVDMCEIARNSCYHSGWSEGAKAYWLGKKYQREGVNGNDPRKTNVPDIRLIYRYETLSNELQTSLKPMIPK